MIDVQRERIKDIIEIFIADNIDKKLDKEKQRELIRICGIKDRFGRIQKSIGQISEYLENNYGCKVRSKKIERRIEGKRKTTTMWVVVKINTTKSAKP